MAKIRKNADLIGDVGVDTDLLNELMNQYMELNEETFEREKYGRRLFVSKERRELWRKIKETIKGSSNAYRMKIYRQIHPYTVIRQITLARARHLLLKAEVLKHYGNGRLACVKCGEDRLACLSIDHIDGGGNIHRKIIARSSGAFYKWLKDKGYPRGYQTLCMNDQFVKRYQKNEEAGQTDNTVDWQHILT